MCVAQVMLERIAALEAMLQQAPIVSGRFTAAPFLYLARPVHQDMSAAVAAAAQLGRYTHRNNNNTNNNDDKILMVIIITIIVMTKSFPPRTPSRSPTAENPLEILEPTQGLTTGNPLKH